jgi:hypothetical protein
MIAKMNLLSTAVWALIKVEDLVLRLLHESIGGDLVDATLPDWERRELRREKVLKGAAGVLSDDELKAIREALTIPNRAPKRVVAKTYRNRLTHHSGRPWTTRCFSPSWNPVMAKK